MFLQNPGAENGLVLSARTQCWCFLLVQEVGDAHHSWLIEAAGLQKEPLVRSLKPWVLTQAGPWAITEAQSLGSPVCDQGRLCPPFSAP